MLEVEYVVRSSRDHHDAEIFQSGRLAAHLEAPGGDLRALLKLEDGSGRVYHLEPRVDGTITPFSSSIYENGGKPILKIKSGVFSYRGKVYLFKSLPEGRSMKGHLDGSKYICRLDNLPHHDVDEIDRLTWGQLSKYRGVDVGRLSGLGKLGHKVTLEGELTDVGIPLSAASYLLYAVG